jgi:predicted flap endonuclease-1-like 5' DNA nuclease
MIVRALWLVIRSAPGLQVEETQQFPWWLVLIILAAVILVLIWALTRNAAHTEAPPPEHGHGESEAVHVETPPASVPPIHTPPPLPEQAVLFPEPDTEPLAAVRTSAPAPSEFKPPPHVVPDDLKLIEGIGPKIASLLHAVGIVTFAQLAETPVSALEEMLDKANLRLGDPTTWPEQARLAAKGDFEGLKALQDSLRGGRRE